MRPNPLIIGAGEQRGRNREADHGAAATGTIPQPVALTTIAQEQKAAYGDRSESLESLGGKFRKRRGLRSREKPRAKSRPLAEASQQRPAQLGASSL